jgi:hypothetical protein
MHEWSCIRLELLADEAVAHWLVTGWRRSRSVAFGQKRARIVRRGIADDFPLDLVYYHEGH